MATRVIKKYANRRLYDTEDSKYVTLKDIKTIIALGNDVKIIDDSNGDDITRALLLQIVAEQELGGSPILNKMVLKQLIRFYGHPMQDMMSNFIAHSVNRFLSQLESMQTQMEKLMKASPFPNLQQYTTKNMQAMADLQRQFFESMMNPGQTKTSRSEDHPDSTENHHEGK